MEGEPQVTVVRLGHRPGRDDRMTTHVALVARALGADTVYLPQEATDAFTTATDVTKRFGGPFTVEAVDSPMRILRSWEDAIVHLTMYGEPIQTVIEDIRARHRSTPILAVVGGGKVPGTVYERADYNIAVTNQPHSEVAGLAVFLDHLFESRELDREWQNASRKVIPQESGKRVEDRE